MFADIEGGKGIGGESVFGPVFEGTMLQKTLFKFMSTSKSQARPGVSGIRVYGYPTLVKSTQWSIIKAAF